MMKKNFKLTTVTYSPGYGDMLGAYHSNTLKKDNDNWTFISSDREVHDAPTVTATYAVSAEAVEQFEEFIKDVLVLENRPKSDMFATDYSPWNWNIDYETTVPFGKSRTEYCSFGEYKKYKKKDYELLKELEKRFMELRGDKIAEKEEKHYAHNNPICQSEQAWLHKHTGR